MTLDECFLQDVTRCIYIFFINLDLLHINEKISTLTLYNGLISRINRIVAILFRNGIFVTLACKICCAISKYIKKYNRIK